MRHTRGQGRKQRKEARKRGRQASEEARKDASVGGKKSRRVRQLTVAGRPVRRQRRQAREQGSAEGDREACLCRGMDHETFR